MVKEDEPPIVSEIASASKKVVVVCLLALTVLSSHFIHVQVTNVVKQWWHLTTADKKPAPNPENLVKVKQVSQRA